jgi:hypothetical protein
MEVADRNAVSTLLGYFYQFDRSILTLFEQPNDGDRVAIECIEDIDVHNATETTAIQCKYYEKSEYNHSVIKPAVMLMLEHFKECLTDGRPTIKYQLSGHFESGQEKLIIPFDIQFLKENFLTVSSKGVTSKKYEEIGVNDAELADFLKSLTIDIKSAKFADQFKSILSAIMTHFSCSPFSAEFFFYNNSLRIIKELSIKTDKAQRTITRSEFLRRIDTSSLLFDEWFVAKRGKAKYYGELRKNYFSTINLSPADRLFIIHVNPSTYNRANAKSLLKQIGRKYSKISKREPKPFSPYALVLGVEEAELTALKQELYNEDVCLSDGYSFKGSKFDPASISRQPISEVGPVLRIFINIEDARCTFASLKRTREIYEFYHGKPVEAFEDTAIQHVKLQIPDFAEIGNII